MDKNELLIAFSFRLKEAMLGAGYTSLRSTSGVCIHKLAEITGYSVQICRRYLRGEAIPELHKISEIAEALDVSPGWLLFGDERGKGASVHEQIIINKKLLHYIFSRAKTLYNASAGQEDIPGFLLALADDISQINASEEQSRKIIDLALSSVDYFK